MRMRGYCLARLLQYSDGDVSGDARKVIEELIERFSTFKIVKQILHWNAGPGEYRDTALNASINSDEAFTHFVMIRQPYRGVANVGGNRRPAPTHDSMKA